MEAPALKCGSCSNALPAELPQRDGVSFCPACETPVRIRLFPAFRRPPVSSTLAQPVVTDDEAACFYHTDKKAVVPCDSCGRFLCSLCDCEIRGRHLCPACLTKSAEEKSGTENLSNTRVLFDNIALILAIVPMLVFYFTLISAPASIFLSIRYWNRKMSVLPRTKIRFIAAILLSTLQILGWTALAIVIIYNLSGMTR